MTYYNMKGRKYFIITLPIFLFLLFFVFVSSARAQDVSSPSYPIAELGNCGSQADCKAFCDEPAHYVACSQWAAKNNIIPEEKVKDVERQAEEEQKFESGEISEGPGGCKTPAECDAYCQNPEHNDECFRFGLEHNLISSEEAGQIQKQMEETKGPGGCKTNDECDVFCSKPENAEACVNYSIKDGTLSPSEAEEVLSIMQREQIKREAMKMGEGKRPEVKKPEVDEKKVAEILKKEEGPGGCKTLAECKEYCQDISHANECLSFVEKNGLASSKDLEKMKAMTEVMTTTGGPGGCKGPAECDQYCALPEHQKECLEFAKKHNLVSPEEAKMIEKMAGGGPGGCMTPAECDAYCRGPQHMEECLMFSVKQGMMSEEDAQRMIEIMKAQERRGEMLKGKPPTGEMAPKMPHMFENGMPKENEWPGPGAGEGPSGPGPQGQMPMAPGGQMPMPPQGQMPPGEMAPSGGQMGGPGGCRTKEECDAYCQNPEHAEECAGFSNNGPAAGQEQPGGEMMPPQGQMPMPPEGQMPPGGEMMPPEGEGGQMPPEGWTPPPGEASSSPEGMPQSLLYKAKRFLAGIGISLSF